ncbi:MAG: MobF family relaxase [Terriglobia bacterium]
MSKEPLNAAQVRSYHENDFVNAEQRYYSEDSTVRGEWQGKLAAQWGLSGGVRDAQFYRLTEGQHPVTGEQLVRHRMATEYKNHDGNTVTSVEHRAGWDATFNAPKSVSITALVGGDERLREAHRESVRTALEELERYTQARIGGNHPAETTGKMIAAKFEHDSARPVNGYSAPHLHTHVVIFNVTETPHGKAHALQPQEFYRSQRYATAVYQSELMFRLRQLGYEIERDSKETPQIKGYTEEYLKASSPRRQQIEQYLEARGLEGYAAAQIAAHRTRQAKVHLTPEEIRRVNRALAAEYGNDPQAIVAQAQARRRGLAVEPHDRAAAQKIAHAALTFARDRNMEREAVVDERVLLRDALTRSLGHARLQDIQANLDARIRSGEFVATRHSSPEHRTYTTAQMLAYERQNLDTIAAGQGLKVPLARPETLRKMQAEFQHLSAAQQKAATEILESHDRITGLQGVAGAGKTTTLNAIRRAAERDDYQVEGFAPTSRAAQQLEEAGIASNTLQHFLATSKARDIEQKHLYLVDESSLVSTKQVHQFFKHLGPNDRVILVGDIRQHQAVEAGRPFEQMQEAGLKTARLEEVIRQQDPELKSAVELLAQGQIREAVQSLDRQGRIHEIKDARERLAAVAKDYIREPDRTLVVAPDNASRTQINRLVHHNLQSDGKVSAEEYRVMVSTNRQELTGADRQWAARYEIGDEVRYARGSREVGISQGEYATVAGVDVKTNVLTVRRQNQEPVTYDPKRLQGVNVYRKEERYFAAGDRIQFTAPFKQQHIANRQLGQIEGIDDKGNLQVRLDSGRRVEFNLREHPHLDYGYAMTSYSSQGQTADRVIVHISGKDADNSQLVNRRFAYVALSRARYDAHIYTQDATTLGNKLSREVSKRAALDIGRGETQEIQKRPSQAVAQQQNEPSLEQSIA